MWLRASNCCSNGAARHDEGNPKLPVSFKRGQVNSARSEQQGPKRDEPVLLLVEDDFDTRWAAAEWLRDAGFRVIEAGDAKEAMSVLSAGEHVDIVFSDVFMPGDFTGVFLAEWIAKHHPSIPVLLTSGAPKDAHIATAPESRQHFIEKPCDPDEVVRRIREMLRLAASDTPAGPKAR
jgi:DNA-binding NtrC family response regulator